jgi:stress response protein SCP2
VFELLRGKLTFEIFAVISQVQLSWGEGREKTDLDCAVIAFNHAKVMLDVCFYNKPSACNKVLTHSGDNRDGLAAGIDEEITLDLNPQLLESILGFVFVVNSATGGMLSDIKGSIAFKGSAGEPLGDAPLPSFEAYGAVAALLLRDPAAPGAWLLRFLATPTKGRNFQESIPQINRALTRALGAGLTGADALAPPDLVKRDTIAVTPPPPPPAPLEPDADDEPAPPALVTGDGDDLYVGSAPPPPATARRRAPPPPRAEARPAGAARGAQ